MKLIAFPESDQKLIQKAVRQDRLAQKQLFERYAPKMLSVCRQYVVDLHYAEDVMITAFAKAFQSLRTFDTQKNLYTWLRKIAVNESIDYLRKQKMSFKEIEDEVYPNGIDSFHQEFSDDIQQIIDRLPQGYKTVFLLYAVEGYSHQEIGKMLGISEGTSKSQLHKARTVLQQQLTQQNLSYGK